MEYKKIYSPEELAEVSDWVKKNLHRMPESLQLDASVFIPDLHKTMEIYLDIVDEHRENETYGAQIRHIFNMRDKLINDNLLLPEE